MPESVMEDEDVDLACPNCSATISDESDLLSVGWRGTSEGCAECTTTCDYCSSRLWSDDTMVLANGEQSCGSCYGSCDGCEDYYWSHELSYDDHDDREYCSSCYPSRRGEDRIRDYGHTRGVMWLKTDEDEAVTREERYYLGIELEIGTSNMTAGPIMDWAEREFGNREAIIGKEDSSVNGFEIVTQPMTPKRFEAADWDEFFAILNREYPLDEYSSGEESNGHGLHVHIGRVAFRGADGKKDDLMLAAYCYLIGQSDHLERIARRAPTGYCNKVNKPVSSAIVASGKYDKQVERLRSMGIGYGRDAINLNNEETVEIRAFKSTRKASELRDAVRLVYIAAEYVRSLRTKKAIGMSGKALHWTEFARWVAVEYPEAFPSISGLKK